MATLTRSMSIIEEYLDRIPAEDHAEFIRRFHASLSAQEREEFRFKWNTFWSRASQRLPKVITGWRGMFWRAGRGFGKTRTGAEAVRSLVLGGHARSILLIGSTAADARDVMIETPGAGLLDVHPDNVRPIYKPSVRTLEWPNGTIGHVRSAEEPDSIRGLSTDLVWGDEPASWKYGKEAWDNAMLGLRVGLPHWLLTGTPRPLEWLRKLEDQQGVVVRTGSTYENMGNLAATFIEMVLAQYENTRLGIQELHAKYLDDVEGALWRLVTVELSRFAHFDTSRPWASLMELLTLEHRIQMGVGQFKPERGERRPWHTWVGVDPPGETAECGIIVGTAPIRAKAGRDHAVILADCTVSGPPEVWGKAVVEAVHAYGCDGVVVESNQGGDMTRSTIHAADPNVRVEKVRAVDSKSDRAEPVSMLYSKDWIHHDGVLARLENQMTTWVPSESPKSPDRLDALVHLVTHLLHPTPMSGRGKARVLSPV